MYYQHYYKRVQNSYLSQISQIICGEILGDFATIYALSCGEKLSKKNICGGKMTIIRSAPTFIHTFSFDAFNMLQNKKCYVNMSLNGKGGLGMRKSVTAGSLLPSTNHTWFPTHALLTSHPDLKPSRDSNTRAVWKLKKNIKWDYKGQYQLCSFFNIVHKCGGGPK